jgi:hypothetical protein
MGLRRVARRCGGYAVALRGVVEASDTLAHAVDSVSGAVSRRRRAHVCAARWKTRRNGDCHRGTSDRTDYVNRIPAHEHRENPTSRVLEMLRILRFPPSPATRFPVEWDSQRWARMIHTVDGLVLAYAARWLPDEAPKASVC